MDNKQENNKKKSGVAVVFSEAVDRRQKNPPNSIERILLVLSNKSVICRGGERFRGMPQAGIISLLGELDISPVMLTYMEDKKLLEPKTIGGKKNYPAVVISKTGEKVLAIMSYLTTAPGEKQ